MKKNLSYVFLLASVTSLPAMAHVGYTGRNFGTFNDTLATSTISNQAVTGNYGWIDGTDSDYGDAHKTLAYRFTLTQPTNVTLSFESQVFTPANPGASPVQEDFMLKILVSATTGSYLKLSQLLGSQSCKTDAPGEDEGLGAVYDTRDWMKNYYGEHYEDDSF